ncbi:MAG: glycosyltransferase [Acidobacteriota bacterium]
MNPATKQWLRLLRPEGALDLVKRRIAKVRRQLKKVDRFVGHFEPPDGVEVKGDVLVAYIADAFMLKEGPGRVDESRIPHSHTHWWESLQIVETFLDLGYRVDATSWLNTEFRPTKSYKAALDVRILLQDWAPQLPADCVKILHAETAHCSWHNPAQQGRLEALEARRGRGVGAVKLIEDNKSLEVADAVTLIGEDAPWVHDSYAWAGAPIYPIPISTPLLFDPIPRDYAKARRRFLWFGSAGLVHKGLDLVLEAFAGMPELELTICGPINREREFEREYWRELYETPNIRVHGWIDIATPDFQSLMARHASVIFQSCSESQNGGIITTMHAGAVPILSRETGVPLTPERGVLLDDCEIDTLRSTLRDVAGRSPEALQALSDAARRYAREHHTRDRFARVYKASIERILKAGVRPPS